MSDVEISGIWCVAMVTIMTALMMTQMMKIMIFFFYQNFLSRTQTTHRAYGKGGDHLLLHSTTSTRSWTLTHLFTTFHVRWLCYVFNRNACIYQTAAQWDLPPYRITVWLIDGVILIFVTAQKMKFFIKDLFNKCDQIRSF